MSKKILIVDDDPNVLTLLSLLLKAHHYAVVMAKDGAEGFAKAQSEAPDLIISDTIMPGLSGHLLVDRIRKMGGKAAQVPIIVISARHSMQQIYNQNEITAFVAKPFTQEVILEAVTKAIGAAPPPPPEEAPPAPAAPAQAAAEAPPAAGKNPAEPFKGQKAILTGVDRFVTERLHSFLEVVGFQVLRADSTEQTLEIAEKETPQFIFIQFWEDLSRLDAAQVTTAMGQNKKTSDVKVIAFCKESLGIEALKYIPRRYVLTFQESKDLLSRVDDVLFEISKSVPK